MFNQFWCDTTIKPRSNGFVWKRFQGLVSLFSLGAILLCCALSAVAQTTSSISGTVQDATGAVIPHATVVLTDEANKFTRSLKANGEGFFSFVGIPPATYDFQASYKGFESSGVTGIVILPGDSYTIPKIRLIVGAVTESVVVTADAAGVTLDSGAQSVTITAAEIQRLSTVGRDTAELVSILPGFTMGNYSGNGGVAENKGPDYQTTGMGSANINSWGAAGGAPSTGALNVSEDGATLTDPGGMNAVLINSNMDQVQEVKVQTADFGADQAKGPVVIDAVGKSGGDKYHGSLYAYYRNYEMNSNDWENGRLGGTRPQTKYDYPGGGIGGPVKIPGTSFNHNNRLDFYFGYEYYGQNNYDGTYTAFVPTAAMRAGDLSPLSITQALNLPGGGTETSATTYMQGDGTSANPGNCANASSQSAALLNVAGICASPSGNDTDGNAMTGGVIPTADIDPGVAALEKFWPTPNHTSQPIAGINGGAGSASDGYNWVRAIIDTTNGYQFHTREDLSISDNLKLYATYSQENVNYSQVMSSAYSYTAGANAPLPTPWNSNNKSKSVTGNLTQTVGASLTNELQATLAYFAEPSQYKDRSLLEDTGTAWASAGYSGGIDAGSLYGYGSPLGKIGGFQNQLPAYSGTWESAGNIPGLDAAYTDPGRGQFQYKYSGNISDNLTKVYKTHTIKIGFYAEDTGNDGSNFGSTMNGAANFMRWSGCLLNQAVNPANLPPATSANAPASSSTGNEIGEFLEGCPLAYSQDTSDPSQNENFITIEGYATDQWKLGSKWTLTLGMRFSHLGPWTDRDGGGALVWEPSELTPHTLLSSLTADPKSWAGFESHETNPSIPIAGVPTRALFYSPRFGIAYDLFGNGKSVFRGGWGAYRYQDPAFVAGAIAAAQGKQTWQFASAGTTGQCDFEQMFNSKYIPCGYYNRSSATSTTTPFAVSALNPHDDERPVTYNYNFTFDQSLPWKMRAEVTYVGSQSADLLTQGNEQNQNVIPLGAYFGPDPVTGQVNSVNSIPNSGSDYRPYPNYQQISVPTHNAWANYNSMQATLSKQAGSLIFNLNYTWSKTLDITTGADPVDQHHDYGYASYDRPSVVNLSYSWVEGSKFHGNKILGAAVNGWEISGIATWETGVDLSATQGGNFGYSGSALYSYTSGAVTTKENVPINSSSWLGSGDYTLQPKLTCDPRSGLKKDQFINGNCFGMPAQGTQGVYQLPYIAAPAFMKWDMSVFKDFKLNGRQSMQFRVDGFNFLNHPITSFDGNDKTLPLYLTVQDDPNTTYTTEQQAFAGLVPNNTNFGSTNWKEGQRILELGFKYNF